MRLFALAVLFTSLTGCLFGGPDTIGTWVGDCSISSFGYEETFDIELDISSDEKKELEGWAVFTDHSYGVPFEGVIVGTRKGKDIEMTLDLSEATQYAGMDFDISMGVEGKVKGNKIDGACVLTAMGIGTKGDMLLERE